MKDRKQADAIMSLALGALQAVVQISQEHGKTALTEGIFLNLSSMFKAGLSDEQIIMVFDSLNNINEKVVKIDETELAMIRIIHDTREEKTPTPFSFYE